MEFALLGFDSFFFAFSPFGMGMSITAHPTILRADDWLSNFIGSQIEGNSGLGCYHTESHAWFRWLKWWDMGLLSWWYLFFKLIDLFLCLILAALGLVAAARGLSLVVVSGGCSSCGVRASHHGGFSWCFLLQSPGSRAHGLRSYVWCRGSLAPRHVGSTWTRDQIHVTW